MTDVAHLLSRSQVRNSVEGCRNCALCDTGSGPIPFRGPSPTKVVVIGEAPGKMEDAVRRPFVGPSGVLAERTLSSAGIDCASVTWLNVVSCFPNRTPTSREVDACRGNLHAQLSLIQPQYCLVLGGVAVSAWWPNIRMGDIRGMWWKGRVEGGADRGSGIGGMDDRPWMMGTWHPSAVLRNGGLESSRGKEFAADVARFRVGIAAEGMSYLNRFRLMWNKGCVVGGEEAEVWLDHDNTVNDDVLGGLGYCRKHFEVLQGKAGGGKKIGSGSKPKPRQPKRAKAVQEGLL